MKYIITTALAFLLAACSTIPVPQTAGQLAYATKGAYVAVKTATASALEQDLISVEQAVEIRNYLQEIEPKLNAAVEAVRHGVKVPDSTVEWLRSVNQALIQILQEIPNEQGTSGNNSP